MWIMLRSTSILRLLPGRGKFRTSQDSKIDNFVMAGDFAIQKYLGSVKCSVLSSKLAAEVVCNKAAGIDQKEAREVCSSVTVWEHERAPVGVRGNYLIAFGNLANIDYP